MKKITEIAVVSGKGGTGKTSTVMALASVAKPVVLADCDVDAADLYIIARPELIQQGDFPGGKHAVIDAQRCMDCGRCMQYCRYDAIYQHDGVLVVDAVRCEGCGLCLRVCPVMAVSLEDAEKSQWFTGESRFGKVAHARLSPGEDLSGKLVTLVREKARTLAQKYTVDTIIIDGSPGIGCPVISSLNGVDYVLAVTEPSISGLHDLKRLVELARHFRLPVSVVVNKFDLNEEAFEETLQWCKKEHLKVIGKLPYTEIVTQAMIKSQSVVEYDAQAQISKEYRLIWDRLLSECSSKTK